MRRGLIGALAMIMIMALVAPASAKVKERDANGATSFMLNATCNPTFQGDPSTFCEINDDGEVVLGLKNPGTKTGTFKGTQFFDGTFFIKQDGTFRSTGTVVFTGRVKACGHGTVEFVTTATGYVTPGVGSGAFFETNEQTIVGGSIPIEGVLRETGNGTGTADGSAGTLDYSGEYTCDQRGRGHEN